MLSACCLCNSEILRAKSLAASLLPEFDYAFYLPFEDPQSLLIAKGNNNQGRTQGQQSKRSSKEQQKLAPLPPFYSSLGLGKTLPGGFYRFRSVTRIGRGDVGFDQNGKELDLGLELNTVVQAAVIEYGLTEELSFQVLIPYVVKNQMSLDYRQFNQTDLFRQQNSQLNGLLHRSLIDQGICSSLEDCQQQIDQGLSLPEGSTLTLPTGEQLPVGGVPLSVIQDSIPQLVRAAATPADGETGIGDIDFGVLYVFHSTKKSVYAFGGGFRLPTGSFENVPRARRGTGEGLVKGALRFNYDYNPLPPLWFSYQHQAEFMVIDGRKKKSSILNPNELNEADPTTDIANTQVVSQNALRHHGLFRLDYGLGGFASALEPTSIELIGHYDLGVETKIDGVSAGPAPQSYRYSYGLKLDGLGLARPLPAYLKFSQERMISGRNLPLYQDFLLVEFAFYMSI